MATTVVDNQYVGLSPLSISDVKSFFEDYIKPFAPYKESRIYNALIDYLINYYYKQVYTYIPNDLKTLYEEANINVPSTYDNLLTAIGVPSTIIKKISFSDKLVFLSSLNDFMRYKGTLSFVQKVGESFGERINIYELYIDYDVSTTSWVFKPVLIYHHADLDVNLESISYSTVYESLPSFLVNEDQLNGLRDNDEIILPIKSNLLFLDSDLSTSVSLLYDVIVAIFLHTYKEDYIDIYFKDTSKTARLKSLYFLWYYLLTKYYNIPWTAFDYLWILRIAYDDIVFPSTIGTIPANIENLYLILQEYDNIDTLSARDTFYTNISNAFVSFSNSSATTVTDMYNELVVSNADLIAYITNRIDSATDLSTEISTILNELYSSLNLYAATYTGDVYFGEYVDYFLKYLPQITIRPESTTTYTVLYNLKPYHVDLYSVYSADIRCKDKFNQIYIDDESVKRFALELHKAGVVNISVDYVFNVQYNKGISDVLSADSFHTDIGPYSEDSNSMDDIDPIKDFDMGPTEDSEDITEESPTDVQKPLTSDIACADSFTVVY